MARSIFAIAGDRSLSFKPGQGFAIDLGEITLDVHDWKWAQEKGLSIGNSYFRYAMNFPTL